MAIDYRIPRPQSPFLDRRGEPTTEWYNWLKKLDSLFTTGDTGLQAQITQIAYILGSPDGTVANIPPFNTDFLPTDTIVRGEVSLSYSGTLAGGQVVITLLNDVGAPGNSYYYGTDALGVKGWNLLDLESLSNVDLTTTPPISGDALVFDGASWVPGAILSNPMNTLGDLIVADTGGTPDRLAVGADGDVLTVVAGLPEWATPSPAAGGLGSIGCTFDGGGSPLTTPKQVRGVIPFNCTIDRARLLSDVSGDAEVDIWVDSYANYPPNSGDSITSATPPELIAADKYEDSALTGWTTSLNAGDTIIFNLTSAATVTQVTATLEVTKI